MKRLAMFVLLLCLALAGCGADYPTEPLPTVPPLPTIRRETAPFPSAPESDPDPAPFPCLFLSDDGIWEIAGPAGIVAAYPYPDGSCSDPAYGDVDGDGAVDLIYWRPGRVSDASAVTLCVYGLEEGWPVLEAASVWQLPPGQPRLTQIEETGELFLVVESESPIPEKTGWYSVAVENFEVLLTAQNLFETEDPVSLGGSVPEVLGSSFAALRERVADKALLDSPSCLVWQRTGIQVLDSDPAGKTIVQTCAAVTENGVTVSGVLRFGKEETGVTCVSREGIVPIPPVEDPEALAGLTAEELTPSFGPCHFAMENRIGLDIPCWFTRDGKLLTVTMQGTVIDASLWDMCAGIPDPEDEADAVIVHQEENPTRLENELRWRSFLAAVELGEESEVTLRMLYDAGEWDLTLRYDGEAFHLNDGVVGVYRYLIVDVEDDPPASAKFRRATHYLLSEDPDMTWQRYMARTLSSYAPPGDNFPATASLFSIFE